MSITIGVFIKARNSTYQLRLDETTKRESFAVFHELGITPAEGMRIFLSTVARKNQSPYPSSTLTAIKLRVAISERRECKACLA